MSSTYSSLLRIELIGTGDQPGLWGDTTNTNLGTLIEQAIAGTATVSVTLGDITLSALNGSSDQSRCAALLITGSAGVTRNVVAPASSKLYVVSNTADAAIILKTSTSTGLTISSGVTQFAYYNGTDFIAVSQPYDADLKALADLATTGIIVRTGSGTATTRTVTASTGITVTNGDGVSGNPTVAVSTIPVANGGTNITSYTAGDLLYASGATTLAKLADVATGNALISGGVGVAPSWGKVDLTAHVTGTLPVANGGTGVTSSTGSGSTVLSTSPTITSATLITPALGTPASGTLTNCTGLPVSTGISGLGTGVATFLATPSSANLAATVTDETGSGALVFANSPTLVTPVLGTPSSGTLTSCTGLPLSTGVTGTLAVANGGTGQNSYTDGQLLIGNSTGNTLTKATLIAGTNISITNGPGAITISASSSGGTVTSVAVSGGTTGLTTSGGPITGSGTITLAGTLAVANGGTGVTTSTGTGSTVLSASPTFTGTPAAPTASAGTNTTQIATTAFVTAAVSAGQPLPAGTLMLFQQTNAPTGWTKQTTHNNKALRVVTGTASSGGTSSFTTVFTDQTPTINVSGLSAAATTLTTTQIPSHNHSMGTSGAPFTGGRFGGNDGGTDPVNTGNAGGGGSHTHSISGSATSSAITLAVQYVDLIIAAKD